MGKQKILKRFAGWKCPNHDLCKSAGNIGEKYKNVNKKKFLIILMKIVLSKVKIDV